MFGFTRQEQIVAIFLIASILVGSGVLLYKRHHPGFAPELRAGDSSSIIFPPKVGEVREVPDGQTRKSSEIVNINIATLSELQRLPGIGPAIAARIIECRQSHGPFKSVDELTEVKGIGQKTLQRIRPYIKAE